jgi:hypothetical protein
MVREWWNSAKLVLFSSVFLGTEALVLILILCLLALAWVLK